GGLAGVRWPIENTRRWRAMDSISRQRCAMKAMVLTTPGAPLERLSVADPRPGPGQVLLKVDACGVCRTDLHVVDGELAQAHSPIIPGHELVGTIIETGADVDVFAHGDRVGVPWLASTCGICQFCRTGRENLCDNPQFTGCTVNGGYADCAVADQRFC